MAKPIFFLEWGSLMSKQYHMRLHTKNNTKRGFFKAIFSTLFNTVSPAAFRIPQCRCDFGIDSQTLLDEILTNHTLNSENIFKHVLPLSTVSSDVSLESDPQ